MLSKLHPKCLENVLGLSTHFHFLLFRLPKQTFENALNDHRDLINYSQIKLWISTSAKRKPQGLISESQGTDK